MIGKQKHIEYLDENKSESSSNDSNLDYADHTQGKTNPLIFNNSTDLAMLGKGEGMQRHVSQINEIQDNYMRKASSVGKQLVVNNSQS